MKTHGLKNWVDKLRQQNMPVLGDVIVELNKITSDQDADVSQLVEVILRDPNLTSHVLRVANSVHYNYSKAQINTVSRAVVHIGLKGMRAVCISLLVIDSLMQGKSKDRVLRLVAQGFHAAVQARNFSSDNGGDDDEEVFIAALLFNLGEMAFWSNEEIVEENTELLSDSPKVRREAMDRVLGTSFKSITKELSKHWNLGDTLEQALFPSSTPSSKVRAVVLGERISRAAVYGWESPQLKKVLEEVAEFTNSSLEDALVRIKEGGDEAAEVALDYGVAEACPLIPKSFEEVVLNDCRTSRIMKGDTSLQLNILRDLANATQDRLNVNTIFQMVIEGMHRGIGLERVCIAFIQNHRLSAKYALGEGTDYWRNNFNFDVGPYSENVFSHAMEAGGSVWMTAQDLKSSEHLYPPNVVTSVGRFPAFIHVVEVDGRKAALFYADRWNFGGQLSESQFDSFKHFSMQAQMSLSLLSAKR